MELRHLRYFVAVAEELHFGRAAKRLHVSQPPLSAQIKDLEHELGARLFDRTHHKVQLTDAGRALLLRARDVLGRTSSLAQEMGSIARGEQGLVTVGYTTTAMYTMLPRAVAALKKQRPGVSLRLEEIASPKQPQALQEGRIDVGIACLPVVADGLQSTVLDREQMTIALPRRHSLVRKSQLLLSDLCSVDCVALRDSTEPGWAQACAAELQRAKVAMPVVAEADTKLALLGLVAAGLGVAVVSSSLAKLGRPGVIFKPLNDARISLALGALHTGKPSALVMAVLTAARPDA